VATALIQNGTLKEGDAIVVGAHSGRIRALIDPTGKKVASAGPSDPVEVLGLSGVPSAGDVIVAVSDERKARQIATMRADRAKGRARRPPASRWRGCRSRSRRVRSRSCGSSSRPTCRARSRPSRNRSSSSPPRR